MADAPTPLDLEAVKERAAKATPGPWEWEDHDDRYESVRNELRGVLDPDGGESRYRAIQVTDDDKDFIAHAREDVPALIAEVERLRTHIDVLAEVIGESERLRALLGAIARTRPPGEKFGPLSFCGWCDSHDGKHQPNCLWPRIEALGLAPENAR